MISTDDPHLPPLSLDWLSPGEAPLWQRLRDWVQSETGMNFVGVRESRFIEAVKKVLARPRVSCGDLETLLGHPEQRCRFLERISAELTVGESFFFRNEHHFRALREHVLPEILRRNRGQRELRIWSAGCAAGEEPYSLAILLDQMLGHQLDSWRISILATDLNPEFLDRARAGWYRGWSFRQTDIHHDRNYLVPADGGYAVVPRIRDRVHFAHLNLVKDVYPSAVTGTTDLDLILFRNVAIYLRAEVTRAIMARFRRALRPGGWLLVGETEMNLAGTDDFRTVRLGHATFHRRAEAPSPEDRPPPLQLPAPAGGTWLIPASGTIADRVPTAGSETPLRGTAPLPGIGPGGDSAAPRLPHLPLAQDLQQWIAAGQYRDAEQAIERIVDRPARARTRLVYCKALLSCAQIAPAKEMLAACLKEDPLLLEAQLLQAAFAEEAGDTQAAEKAYRRAIYIDRHCAMSHFHLALVLDHQGKRDMARQSLELAMALTAEKPPEASVEYGEGLCYGRLRELLARLINR